MLVPFIFFAFFIAQSCQKELTMMELLAQPIPEEAQKLTGKALVDYVNERQSFYRAEYSEKAKSRVQSLMKMEYIGKAREMYKVAKKAKPYNNDTSDIPESFDARKVWDYCPSIRYIRDQSSCGSCWAVSAAETMSDRLCIQTKGKVKVTLSDVDILSCCGEICGYGCDGGYAIEAWNYTRKYGVCSGGRYEEQGFCKQYPLHPCGRHQGQKFYGPCPDTRYNTPKCKPYCQYGYGKRYYNDKYYVNSARILENDEVAIQREIMKNGPVQAAMLVYEDFSTYINGVYMHIGGNSLGAHTVKIIGWGANKYDKYWIVANSWNTDWGEDGGYFRILRGVNHCMIEEEVIAGDFRV
ncbi:hypothetical protein V3C99_005967 [Haemonchus contortus]|uniref:Pept_C1 domain-containing protein n=1 Tax=Haemonchus contortus TaxID=6289 RepID=A0A7I4XSN9_HAECO